MKLRVFLSIAPVVAFLVVSRATDAWVAVAAGFGASVLVFLLTRRDRLIGVLSLFGFCVVGVSAALGVFWNSERAYLASSPASDFLFVPLYLVSIWLRRPLVGRIVHELFPKRFAMIPTNHHVFVRLSVAWAGFDIVHGVVLTTLLLNLGIVEYIVWSRVVGWPMTGAMLVMSFIVVQRTAEMTADARLCDAEEARQCRAFASR